MTQITPSQRAGMRLIAIQDAIASSEKCIRILESEETTAKRDLREAEEQPALQRVCPNNPDWDRWHELLDIRAERTLTTSEEQEYEEYARIAAQLDAEEGRAADAALDNLVKEHERVIASIRRLTAAVRAAAEQRGQPAEEPAPPPIEVEMRLGTAYGPYGPCALQCKLGGIWCTSQVSHTSLFAQQAGEEWLAALGKQLDVTLVAKWEEKEPDCVVDFSQEATAARQAKRAIGDRLDPDKLDKVIEIVSRA